jgi:hypothetical protein
MYGFKHRILTIFIPAALSGCAIDIPATPCFPVKG